MDRTDVRDWERRGKAVNCRFYDQPKERKERASVKAWGRVETSLQKNKKKKPEERKNGRCDGGVVGFKRAIISERERETGIYRDSCPSQCPVPWGGTQGKTGECEAWGGEQSRLLSPREKPCSGMGRRAQEVSHSLYEWMDGWLAAWMGAGSPAGRLAGLLAHREGM